ncbi:MAG: hypothetical protein ABIY52_13770 [Gemmatimonadaceae bacterium]
MRFRHIRRLATFVLATSLIAGCVHSFWTVQPTQLSTSDQRVITSPVKVHLLDGGTVVFRNGVSVSAREITGAGKAYRLLDDVAFTDRDRIPIDSVVGLESFDGKLLTAQSVVVSVAATGLAAIGTAGLLLAIFGSCPTVYADTGAAGKLQAEGFSYAIAPLLEHRDVDPLDVRPGPDGIIRLELRNEALETHFINHIELLAVKRPAGASVVPDQSGKLVVVSDMHPLSSARDRAGRDVSADLADADGRLFATAPATVNAARAGDLDDYIDIETDALPAGDSIAVVLRLRNSLLNTVLLYDGILGGPDAADWLVTGLQQIGTALDLSRWYTRTMGMHATVDGVALPASGEHARLGDVGPIAFRDVAIVLPRPSSAAKNVRVRLRFVADDWRIDRARFAGVVTRPTPATLHLSRVIAPNPARGGPAVLDTAALRALGEADNDYLETHPGQRMTLEFASRADSSTTYLIAWQGWYREWIRGAWLAEPTRTKPWVPGDSAVSIALTRWRAKRDGFERAFYSSRIPVR